jgi:hypothetical protein
VWKVWIGPITPISSFRVMPAHAPTAATKRTCQDFAFVPKADSCSAAKTVVTIPHSITSSAEMMVADLPGGGGQLHFCTARGTQGTPPAFNRSQQSPARLAGAAF